MASCWSSRSPEGGAPSTHAAGGKIVWAELPLAKAPDLTPETPPLPHRVPSDIRAPEGKAKEQVETALMERVLEGLRRL